MEKKKASYSAIPIDDKCWGLSVCLQKSWEDLEQQSKTPVALHYVLDNSLSMGPMTIQVRDIFSVMVDSVATKPCSLTVFKGNAEVLSSDISTGKQMRDLELPSQGNTNISAGIEKALRVIYGQEMAFEARNKKKELRNNDAEQVMTKTHHILILLSDGEHNSGPQPTNVFPTLRKTLPEDVNLSVIAIGYSQHSNTSMGMLLKKSIETVAFDTETVQTIYFAKSKTALHGALANLGAGLNSALQGSFHDVETLDKQAIFLDNLNSSPVSKLRIHMASTGTALFSFLCCADEAPKTLLIDNEEVSINAVEEEFSADLLARLIQNLIDKTKIQIVAAKNGVATRMAKKCAERLEDLVQLLETKNVGKKTLELGSASPKERINQYRSIRAVCHQAKAFRNQILDIANFSSGESEKAANFLNGRSMKYANKALRRAAKKMGSNEEVADPKLERKAMLKELLSDKFQADLRLAMNLDALNNLACLPDSQFDKILIPHVKKQLKASHHVEQLRTIRRVFKKEKDCTKVISEGMLSGSAIDLVASGKLSEYLNQTFHGSRVSYLSLSTPFQHLEEWLEFKEQSFDSTWEMLMYAGFNGYPIVLERSSASQMNPFLVNVKSVRLSLADSASICVANQAEVPVYGPEGGAPFTDILVLIDPAMPRSSKMICSGKLVGEKYTSAVISRDLHMYTGINMRIALHGNTVFHLVTNVERRIENDVIADLRRKFMGRAFMCSSCGFGPVDHYACSDLLAHDGEETHDRRAVIDNSCPHCGWFSPDLSDWKEWDGTVCSEFVESELLNSRKDYYLMEEARIDLMLRILYSFRKTVEFSSLKRKEYRKILQRFSEADDEIDLSTRSGIDGMSQILLALLCPSNLDEVTNVAEVLRSEDAVLSVIKEACFREARKVFRMKSKGDKEKSKQLAISYLTELLGVDEVTAPYTMSLMEPEPSIENVRSDCDDGFELDYKLARQELGWVRGISKQWSRVWSVARELNKVMISSEVAWDDIERNMETGLSSYQYILDKLKKIEFENLRDILGVDIGEFQSLLLRIGVEAIYTAVLDKPLISSMLRQDEDILNEVAREMRMKIYFDRVKDKMAQWKDEGQSLVYYSAKAADIAQFSEMLDGHAHGLEKHRFWGLWNAAKNTKNAEKIAHFLKKANDCFGQKHAT